MRFEALRVAVAKSRGFDVPQGVLAAFDDSGRELWARAVVRPQPDGADHGQRIVAVEPREDGVLVRTDSEELFLVDFDGRGVTPVEEARSSERQRS